MCLCDCNLALFVLCRDNTLQSVLDGPIKLFFLSDSTGAPMPHIVGRNQYSAEFGLGPLIRGLTYPIQYSSNSSLPVTIQW